MRELKAWAARLVREPNHCTAPHASERFLAPLAVAKQNELRVFASQRRRKNSVGLNRERGPWGLCLRGGYIRGCPRRGIRLGPMVAEALGRPNGGTMGLGGDRATALPSEGRSCFTPQMVYNR